MIVQICKLSQIPEGGGVVQGASNSDLFPDLAGLSENQVETRVFSSFHEFASHSEIHNGADLQFWLHSGHVVNLDVLKSCVDAHQFYGQTATTFHSNIEFEEEWQRMVYGDVPHELLMGWENLRMSCFARGKYLAPVAPLMVEGQWLVRFATWLRKRISKQEADVIGLSDYVSAMMGRVLRNDKKKLRLVPSPFMTLKLGQGLPDTPDFRRRALIRELSIQAADKYQPLPAIKKEKLKLLEKVSQRVKASMENAHPFHQGEDTENDLPIPDLPPRLPAVEDTKFHSLELDAITAYCATLSPEQLIAELKRGARVGIPQIRVSMTRVSL